MGESCDGYSIILVGDEEDSRGLAASVLAGAGGVLDEAV